MMTPCNNTTTSTCPTANASTTQGVYPKTPIEPHAILKIIFGSLSILLNGFLLLAMLKERKKLFASRVSYLVANLALTDFLIGVVLVFVLQPIELSEQRQPTLVDLELPFIWAAMFVSIFTLFFMSAERFVVVALPMLWSRILTTRRTIICICITWCLAIISGVMIHYHREKTQFALIVAMEVCVVVFIGIHVYIVWWINCSRQSQFVLADDAEMEMSPWPSPEMSSHVSSKQQGEVTTVVVILLIVLIVTILPHFICLQIFSISTVFGTNIWDNLDGEKFILAYNYTDALSYLNFVVNPIVYAWRLTMYRKAFKELLKSVCVA